MSIFLLNEKLYLEPQNAQNHRGGYHFAVFFFGAKLSKPIFHVRTEP